MFSIFRLLVLFSLFFCLHISLAYCESACFFTDEKGILMQAKRLADVPIGFRSSAKCFKEVPEQAGMTKPSEVELSGNIRRELSSTSVGQVELRWPRSVELLFGRTPQRALAEAARAVSRAVKRGGFPSNIEGLNLKWEIVFFDKDLPVKQLPMSAITGCHPGWMFPPAFVYVAADALVSGCSGKSKSHKVADTELARVLIHEMGHAVENQLLGGRMGSDRQRAEGFASWFEQYASEFAPVIPSGSTRRLYESLARRARDARGSNFFTFTGSAEDYAQAAMYFSAIEKRFGVRGVMELYKIMSQSGGGVVPAISERYHWNEKRLGSEIDRILNSRS